MYLPHLIKKFLTICAINFASPPPLFTASQDGDTITVTKGCDTAVNYTKDPAAKAENKCLSSKGWNGETYTRCMCKNDDCNGSSALSVSFATVAATLMAVAAGRFL